MVRGGRYRSVIDARSDTCGPPDYGNRGAENRTSHKAPRIKPTAMTTNRTNFIPDLTWQPWFVLKSLWAERRYLPPCPECMEDVIGTPL